MIIVETPLQLLCAYEYINVKNRKEKIYVRMSSKRNDEQIINAAKILDMEIEKFYVKMNLNYLVVNVRFLHQYLITVFMRKELVIGTISSRFLKLLVKLIPLKCVILLDDGIATLLEEKLSSHKYRRFSIFKSNNKINDKNNFSNIRSKLIEQELTDSNVYFVGQKLSEVNIMREDLYISMVAKIAKKVDSLVYISHRGENKNKVDELKKIPKLKILNLDCPVELYFLERGVCPSLIYTHSSTSAITISLLFFKTKVKIIKGVPIDRSKFPHINLYYEYIKLNTNVGEVNYG